MGSFELLLYALLAAVLVELMLVVLKGYVKNKLAHRWISAE